MTKVFDLSGNVKGEMNLPSVFLTPYRPDLIKRAFLSIQSNKRQPYGADPLAGHRTSAFYKGVRKGPHHMMNREMSRMKRIHGGPPALTMTARFVPQATKGRKAHPPKPEKKWTIKINRKERRLAIKSAIASTILFDIVSKKHKIPEIDLPIIITDDFEHLKKTKDIINVLKSLKLEDEIKRAEIKKIRAGKGKMRGRRYKKKKSVLFIVSKSNGIVKACKNIPGVDICNIKNLNVELLAPGAQPGRLTIFTESAIQKLGEIYG